MTDTILSTETLYETAKILAKTVPAKELNGVQATLTYLHHANRPVTPEALQELVPCDLSNREARIIVFELEQERIIDSVNIDESALDLVFGCASLLQTRDVPPENLLVATIPYDDAALPSDLLPALHGNLMDLIRTSKDELILLSPFLSEQAYERLRPALHTAAGKGADIVVVTRYLTYGDPADYKHNREFVDCVCDDGQLADKTKIYEYRNDETFTTFHAKMVIADSERAYLGTANLTKTGLGKNLELGVVFNDETVEQLSRLVNAFLRSSFLHEVQRRAEGFERV